VRPLSSIDADGLGTSASEYVFLFSSARNVAHAHARARARARAREFRTNLVASWDQRGHPFSLRGCRKIIVIHYASRIDKSAKRLLDSDGRPNDLSANASEKIKVIAARRTFRAAS